MSHLRCLGILNSVAMKIFWKYLYGNSQCWEKKNHAALNKQLISRQAIITKVTQEKG